MKQCSLDTNCILALLLPERDTQRNKVVHILGTNECRVSDQVFCEVEFILSKAYELPREVVANNIRAIINLENIHSSKSVLQKVLPLYEKHPVLSFVDVYLALQAKLNNAAPLYTFDRKLANQMDEASLLQ